MENPRELTTLSGMDSTPDLKSYDLIMVNTSAGKDSQAMLDYVIELADQAGVRDRILSFHADLGRVEWPGTAELAQEHAEAYGVRFVKIKRPQGDLLDHIEQRGMFPDSARRYCTSDHKRGQGRKAMTAAVNELYSGSQIRVLNCIGLRRQESAARKKKTAMRFDSSASNGRRHVDEWLPILEWSVEDVRARIKQAGTRHHWAYDLGMPRLSCCFCVLASRRALVCAAQNMPELAAEYARVESKIGHRFRRDLSMAEIIEAAQQEAVEAVDNWAA